MESTLGCSHTTILYHFYKIELFSKLEALTPSDLRLNQLKTRVEVCPRLLDLYSEDLPLKQIITCDEKWVLYVNYIRKHQWVPRTAKARATRRPRFIKKAYAFCLVGLKRLNSLGIVLKKKP